MPTPVAEVKTDTALVEALLAKQCPSLAGLPVSLVENGWDNAIYRLGDSLVVRLPRRAFAAPLVASEAIGMTMGIGFAQAIDPSSGASSPALGQFFSILLTLLFLSVDGHLILVDLILRSYTALPPGAAWLTPDRLKGIALFGGYAFLAGLLLALPVGFLLLCLNVVVGMLSRSAPALNLFAVGIPASLAVGVVALFAAMPAMGDYLQVIIREALAATATLVLN